MTSTETKVSTDATVITAPAAAAATVTVTTTTTVTSTTTPAAAPATAAETFTYFAIGSMINPTSLSLRGLKPLWSAPAEVRDWELKFMGEGGMGTIEEKKGASLHGVLHLMTKQDMDNLDRMEAGYDHVTVTAHLYDGTTKEAIAYRFKPDRVALFKVHNPPGERYLDIIMRGCNHFGVKESWIEYLKAHPCTPRKKPSEYKKLPDPTDPTKFHTYAEVAVNNGLDGKPLWFVLNGKVLAFTGDATQPTGGMPYQWLRDNVGGKDATLQWARGLYEPLYPIAESVKGMHPDHRGLIEDMVASGRMMSVFTVIGLLRDE